MIFSLLPRLGSVELCRFPLKRTLLGKTSGEPSQGKGRGFSLDKSAKLPHLDVPRLFLAVLLCPQHTNHIII